MSVLVPFRSDSGAIAVSDYLTNARDWLATCVEVTGPEQIAAAKAELSTVAEATKQMGLSKEIQADATEMVRRSEYALGKAIRRGQAEGTIAIKGSAGMNIGTGTVRGTDLASPTDFAKDVELYDRPTQGKTGILTIADSATDSEFEAAVADAKAEGDLSRANVARKIRARSADLTKQPFDQRLIQIKALAEKGLTSTQISEELGIGRQQVRNLANRADYTIRADAVMGRGAMQRLNWNRVMENVSMHLETTADRFADADPHAVAAQLDRDQADEWLDSLTSSINALSKAVKKIKESYRDQG